MKAGSELILPFLVCASHGCTLYGGSPAVNLSQQNEEKWSRSGSCTGKEGVLSWGDRESCLKWR